MNYVSDSPPVEDKCNLCGKCVSITVTSNPLDYNSGLVENECQRADCEIMKKYNTNTEQRLLIDIIDCEE